MAPGLQATKPQCTGMAFEGLNVEKAMYIYGTRNTTDIF
jgi:hypothetical protein